MELLHTTDMYSAAPRRVAAFDQKKLKILQKHFAPKPIVDVVPSVVRQAFEAPNQFIRRSDDEVQAALDGVAPLKPY